MIIIERFEWNIKYRIKILVASNYICNEGLDKKFFYNNKKKIKDEANSNYPPRARR